MSKLNQCLMIHASLSAVWTDFSHKCRAVGSYTFLDANFQFSILHHVDAVVQLPRTEDVLAFVQLHKEHVLAQLQEQGLLKVPKDPAAKKIQRENLKWPQEWKILPKLAKPQVWGVEEAQGRSCREGASKSSPKQNKVQEHHEIQNCECWGSFGGTLQGMQAQN